MLTFSDADAERLAVRAMIEWTPCCKDDAHVRVTLIAPRSLRMQEIAEFVSRVTDVPGVGRSYAVHSPKETRFVINPMSGHSTVLAMREVLEQISSTLHVTLAAVREYENPLIFLEELRYMLLIPAGIEAVLLMPYGIPLSVWDGQPSDDTI